MSTTKEGKFEVETGQVYLIKEDSKNKNLPGSGTIKIDSYFKEGFEKHGLKNIWKILIKNESGDWVPPTKPLLFGQQIEAHYNLEFEPLTQIKSRLEDLEDI